MFDFSTPAGEFRRLHSDPYWTRRTMELAALCRVVELESPRLSEQSDLGAAYARLRASGPHSARVLRSPGLLLWVNVSRYFVMRNMHQSLPIGHVRDHLRDLRRLAFAAACADGSSCDASARIEQDGRVSLPGLGLVLTVKRRHAGEIVRLETDGATVTATLGPQRFTACLNDGDDPGEDRAGAAGWIALPRLEWGMRLDDSVEMFRVHLSNNPAWRTRHLDLEYIGRWLSCSKDACRLLSLVEDDLWVPVRDVLSSVVPLESPPQVNLSGTNADVLGCICTSLSVNPAVLAETLVHEAAHTALHILTDETSCWEPTDIGQHFRSPWRNDLRPLSGMVHGIFAFLGVGEFWALLLQSDGAREFDQLGRVRLRTVARQVQKALAEVKDVPELTEAGEQLLGAAAHRVEQLIEASRFYAPTTHDERAIEDRLALHDVELPQPRPVVDCSIAARSDPEWSRELGAMMPPPVNRPDLRLVRREYISDRIQLAALKNDPVLSGWDALLRATRESEPESASFVEGCMSYGRGDFLLAVTCYAGYVERRWDDLDAWRLLGAALRRAGRCSEALVIAFDLDELQRYAAADVRARLGADWPLHLTRLARGRAMARGHGD